jgi:RNA polymerase sigma-70 factor (ECF subfamily)
MQNAQSNIGSEQSLDASTFAKESQEMLNVLTQNMASLHRRAYRYLGNAADAEDAVQDALLSACRHLDQFKGQSKISTWLTTIVINSALTQLRRRSRQTHMSLDERFGEEEYSLAERLADRRPSPEAEYVRSELVGRLMQFVEELPPSLRKAFQLRELDGMTISETANVLGVAEVTVKVQVSRARARLRRVAGQAFVTTPHSPSTGTTC